MTDVDVFGASYSYFTVSGDGFDGDAGDSDSDTVFGDEDAETATIIFDDSAREAEDSGGGRRKETFVVGDGKKTGRSLERRDTFTLEELPGPLRAKSSGYGIESIMGRAETLGPLSTPVREYLASHLRMMGEENKRILKGGKLFSLSFST